jgi:hypothetical protein
MSRKAKKINLDQNTIADAVQKTGSRAASYLHDPAKARQLLTSAMGKAGEQKPTDGPLAEVWHYLQALLRLLGAYTRREYTDIPWGSILLVAGAILYFVMPVDLIPDLIPVGGLVGAYADKGNDGLGQRQHTVAEIELLVTDPAPGEKADKEHVSWYWRILGY